MEFVRLKYANNKLIDSDIREHREIISDYVEKKGFDYLGYIPVLFAPNGKPMEVDLIFKKRVERPTRPIQLASVERPAPVVTPRPVAPAKPQKPSKQLENPEKKHKTSSTTNDLYNDRGLDLILNGGDDDLIGEGK